MGAEETILDEDSTGGLGRLVFHHPAGTFALTPASHILLNAIVQNQTELSGVGMDWGSGIGCLAILAARIPAVRKVYGLEISKENVKAAARNAEENRVAEKTKFLAADSYAPFDPDDRRMVEGLRRDVDFILSNPPSSDWDDGFGFRRIVMDGARAFLKPGGIVLLNISFQYGPDRVASLHRDGSGFAYEGVAASTGWVPFDLGRQDLLNCLRVYAREEETSGLGYVFSEDGRGGAFINARTALKTYEERGTSPMTKWQTHRFRHMG
jgi:methylase of polypeptide subunit release factors